MKIGDDDSDTERRDHQGWDQEHSPPLLQATEHHWQTHHTQSTPHRPDHQQVAPSLLLTIAPPQLLDVGHVLGLPDGLVLGALEEDDQEVVGEGESVEQAEDETGPLDSRVEINNKTKIFHTSWRLRTVSEAVPQLALLRFSWHF